MSSEGKSERTEERRRPVSVAISFSKPIPEAAFLEFREILASGGTLVEAEERETGGPYAGIEWLIPTAVIIFLGKAYFEGILNEMGKEHYALLKRAFKTLYARLVGPKAPKLAVVSTPGKVGGSQPYSLVFSLLAEGDDGLRFKLLIQSDVTEAEYDAAINAFLSFLDAFHRRQLTAEIVDELRAIRVVGKTLLLAYNPKLGRVSPVDPLERRQEAQPKR